MQGTSSQFDFNRLPEVCTVADVARFLGVSENTVYTAVRRKELPAKRIGRRVLISRMSLWLWLMDD